VASEATMYLWVAAPAGTADELLERGVLVSPGEYFGPSGAGYIRFALVPTLEECRKAAGLL
jgi:LL-diaminopimelate aminotransferase